MSNAAAVYSVPAFQAAVARRRAVIAANTGSQGRGARYFPKADEQCVWYLKGWDIRLDRQGYYDAKALKVDPSDVPAAIAALAKAQKLRGTQYNLECVQYAPGTPLHEKTFYWQLDMPIPDDAQLAAIAADPKKGFRPGPDQLKALFRVIGPEFVDFKSEQDPNYDASLDLNLETNWASWLDAMAGQTSDGTPVYVGCVPYVREHEWIGKNGKSGVDRTYCLGSFTEVTVGDGQEAATETAPVVAGKKPGGTKKLAGSAA